MAEPRDPTAALQAFAADPQRAGDLAAFLGFTPMPSPVDLLSRRPSPLQQFFATRTDMFGVGGLYRVGGHASLAGLYVAVLDEWGNRSSDRDRTRRRIARALIELNPGGDARSLFVMVPGAGRAQVRAEAEFVLPRVGPKGSGGPITTVRALVHLQNPTRFHRDMLRDLAVERDAALIDVVNRWQQVFSVERVTTDFYQRLIELRDAFADKLEGVGAQTEDVRHLWATRLLGRMLFLWFLQAKRWLGGDSLGWGSERYFEELWQRRSERGENYYADVLAPLFFDVMAWPAPRVSRGNKAFFESTPYLNGSLFQRNAQEESLRQQGTARLPNECFDPEQPGSLLELLTRYRFTTQEATPDDQSVDPDPELLGRVFENLHQAKKKHDTGTYYTPREIVQFMCRRALDGYLRGVTGVAQASLDRLRDAASEPDAERGWLEKAAADALGDALSTVTVCDPAVGSGAFLLGAMHEIILLRRGILHAQTGGVTNEAERITEWKREAIQSTLYGVDINPEAIEICQLRLWLSLVLDVDDPDTIETLPNLDFRVVAGDSLIDRLGDISFVDSLSGVWQAPFEVVAAVNQQRETVRRGQQDFLNATAGSRADIRRRVRRAKLSALRLQVEAQRGIYAEQAAAPAARDLRGRRKQSVAADRLAVYDAAIQMFKDAEQDDPIVEKPFVWKLAFPDVFEHGGFHIVLANPPYVRMEEINNEDERTYSLAFPQVAAGRADLLVYFYARALQILRDGGWLAFISSNKYMRAGYGAGLRALLSGRMALEYIVDFGDLPLFEANGKQVAAYPAVVVARKGTADDHLLRVADLNTKIRRLLADAERRVTTENVRWALESLEALLDEAAIDSYPQPLLKRDGWILEHPTLVRLFDRLMATGTPLGEFVQGRIYMGVKTGLNEAFVVDKATRDRLVAEDARSADLLKPWLSGRDIKRWQVAWPGTYVIFTNRGVDIEAYPAIKRYLLLFRAKLEKRATAHLHPWYELQQPQEGVFRHFAGPKLLWPRNMPPTEMRFTYDTEGFYMNDKAYLCLGVEPWLVSLLNSTLSHWLSDKLVSKLQNGWLEMKSESVVSLLPIIPPGGQLRVALEEMALSPVNRGSLDHLVEEMYGIGAGERDAVTAWYEGQLRAHASSTSAASDGDSDD